jgi:hypothetical protein
LIVKLLTWGTAEQDAPVSHNGRNTTDLQTEDEQVSSAKLCSMPGSYSSLIFAMIKSEVPACC